MKSITLDHIAKVEGHGRLQVSVKNGKVSCAQMEIFEGVRYFEALVLGRDYTEVPSITSRICGICSQSHLIAALYALEKAMKIRISKQTQALRELMVIGSIIQSHVLHLYFLALADYKGVDNPLQLLPKYKKEVLRGLKLKRFANDMVNMIGGREIHSIRPQIGGFTRYPTKEELKELSKQLKELKPEVEATVKLFKGLKYPKFERQSQYLALRDQNRINYVKGNLLASDGTKFTAQAYHKYLLENLEPYSTSKCVTLKKREYMVGALARINVNRTLLSRNTKRLISASKVKFPNYNPYLNNLAQAFELMDLFDKAVSILDSFPYKEEKWQLPKPKAGNGAYAIEAPRGLLFHSYEVNSKGKIKKADIIAPTTQNLKNIEADVQLLMPELLKRTKSEKTIKHELAKLVRAYDPCISCSTHSLKVQLDIR